MQPDQGSQEIFGSWILVQDFFLILGSNELNDYKEHVTGFQGVVHFFCSYAIDFNHFFSSVQQICNAVTISRLLNATLVIPKFLYSNVWLDKSQFGDIYQEDYFINYLKSDIRIVKDLPVELQSLDLEVIGSLVSNWSLFCVKLQKVHSRKIFL